MASDWVPFGTHVDQPDVWLEFSAVTDEDGLPMFERAVTVVVDMDRAQEDDGE